MNIELQISDREITALKGAAEEADRFFSVLSLSSGKDDDWGVAGNTFRAFRNCDFSPSARYRIWANARAQELVDDISLGQCQFAELHDRLVGSLTEHWGAIRALEPYKVYKLVDLFVLRMARFKDLSEDLRKKFRDEGHPGLDTHILSGLAATVPGLVVGSPAMGAIKSKNQYSALQDAIRQITKVAEVPNLNFDRWWYRQSQKKIER